MSNYTDFLTSLHQINDPGAEEVSSLNLFGTALGAAADISGAIGLGMLVFQFIDMVVSNHDDGSAALARELTRIENSQRTQHYLDRLRALDRSIAPAQTALSQLKAALQGPPVSNEYKLQQIGITLTVLNEFDNDDQWATNYADAVYYQDPFNTVRPPQRPDGTAFSPQFILPQFLRALAIFLAVGGGFDADFRRNYADDLGRFARRLRTVHDTAAAGITDVGIDPSGQNMLVMITPIVFPDGREEPYYYQRAGDGSCVGFWADPGLGEFDNNGFWQIYGSVDRYGTWFGVGNYPGIPVPDSGPPLPASFIGDFQRHFAFYAMVARIQCYLGMGLGRVREAIVTLESMLGKSGPPVPETGTWSMRSVMAAFQQAFPGVFDAGNPASLASFAGALFAQGRSTPPTPSSLLQAIDAVSPHLWHPNGGLNTAQPYHPPRH